LGISIPVKTRAIAPNGTIGIVAETTTSGEPMFAAAIIRRWLDGKTWKSRYVIDPLAKRLVASGVSPESIEDSYSIAKNVERRVAMQAWLQKYVDHGISSTVNMQAWGTEYNNADTVESFGTMLMGYLPQLRGITCYPDGARGGQPLTSVPLAEALEAGEDVFYESVDVCDLTKAGSCG
jgi:ribonucleoside-diphosphate reductase alpha chain